MLIMPLVLLNVEDENDRKFLERLYREHHDLIYRTAYRVLKKRQGLDDIVSEVCVVMVRKVKILRRFSREVLRRYIISCTKNAAVYYAKQEQRRYRQTAEADMTKLMIGEQEDEQPSTNRIIRRELAQSMLECINDLSDRDHKVLRLRYFDNLSDAEIAEILDVKPDTVRSCLSRARRRALRIYKEKHNEEE
jgi:RNA polymerase sigma-70 factor (ECF subfamily)